MRFTVKQIRTALGLVLAGWILLMNGSLPVQAVRQLPESMTLVQGQMHWFESAVPITLQTEQGAVAVTSSGDETLGNQAGLRVDESGETKVQIKLWGFLPVKEIQVSVVPQQYLVPGGSPVGVALRTYGVLVVGMGDVDGKTSPARVAGIRPGDILLSYGGEEIQSAQHFSSLVVRNGVGVANVTYEREGQKLETNITPVLDTKDGAARLGAWVRDSTAGIGTLSFFDPQTKAYGALGHAIIDMDTGVNMPVGEGDVLSARIVDVVAGQRGKPGELKGMFESGAARLGNVTVNNSYGIYGKMEKAYTNPLYPQGLPIGTRSMVKTGPAQILTTVDGGGVVAYDCNIERVQAQGTISPKSMVIEITDPDLIAKTGGIVQGMSGSPIIQNGHIVGAVTHVYVSDPLHGYGVFIEWMLEQVS